MTTKLTALIMPAASVGLGVLLGLMAYRSGHVALVGAEQQQGAKPFVHVPDTVSVEARKFLEALGDPATQPAFPAPNDLPAWKRAWEANEAAHKPSVEAVLRRLGPVVLERKLGGTREIFLSHCVRQYRAIDAAGGNAVLDLYEGMPHVFQIRPEMADAPETRTALTKMAAFLRRYLAY